MKNTKKFSLLLIAVVALALSIMSCGEQKTESIDSQMLVVERQYIMLDGFSPNGWDQAEFVVDVPMNGPQPLLDSLKVFLNETLYDMFEIGNEEKFDFKLYKPSEVYIDDMPNLLASYADKYHDHLKKNLCWFVTYNIFLIAQTESFVTYGVECYHGSGSTGSEFLCYTFNKKDGHRLENILTKNDLIRFFYDHPEIKAGARIQALTLGDDDDWNIYDAGLTREGLLIGDLGMSTHYELGLFSYNDILPYLSENAQKLVKNMGTSSKWRDCFMGERLAMINTTGNRDITLIVRPAKHDWVDGFDCFDPDSEDYGTTNNLCYGGNDLMAFYVENGKYTPANVLDGNSVIEGHWDRLYSTNPAKDVFAFDTANNKLYVPSVENVTMGHHECNDKYAVYRYNNFDEFVYEGEEGGFWLHPSLRQFGRLLYALKTKDYLIRIDEMKIYDDRYDDQFEAARVDTCRYRYAAWNNKGEADEPDYNMLDEPDLVIYNGYLGESGFVFLNNGYKYVIQLREENSFDESWLLVYHGDKLIYKKCLRNWDFESELSFDWDCDL